MKRHASSVQKSAASAALPPLPQTSNLFSLVRQFIIKSAAAAICASRSTSDWTVFVAAVIAADTILELSLSDTRIRSGAYSYPPERSEVDRDRHLVNRSGAKTPLEQRFNRRVIKSFIAAALQYPNVIDYSACHANFYHVNTAAALLARDGRNHRVRRVDDGIL